MTPPASTSDSPTLRREPQQARSRARLAGLLDAAEKLLVREGPEALTTTRIAEEAGVSVGSLYRWFPDKAAIVDALTRRYLAEFEATIDELAAAAPTAEWDDLAGMLLDVFAHRGVSQPGYRALWLGRQFSEELQAADRANKAILADGVRRILVGRRVIADTEEAATACRAGVLAADALLHEAFRLDPDGDPGLMDEGKELLRAYLRTAARRFPPKENAAP
ncbi:MAG TPA: TetR/AcrR family transcriptional regulator [Thermoleophilaceae bacterium]|nr:TetR/AcrR family transcriptional regulator [Thermoleophilaceae bacterium]